MKLPLFLVPALLLAQAAGAQSVVYRCPGPPVLYTDALSAKEAQEKGCKAISDAGVSVVQTPRRAKPAAAASGVVHAREEVVRGRERVDRETQQVRDNDRRKLLESELRDAEAKLAALKREFQNGEPERRGDERNFAKYQERVNEMKAAITRQEADVQAIKRELSKLP